MLSCRWVGLQGLYDLASRSLLGEDWSRLGWTSLHKLESS